MPEAATVHTSSLGFLLHQVNCDWERFKAAELPKYQLIRLAWLSHACGLFTLNQFRIPVRMLINGEQCKDSTFHDEQEASWRALKCLSPGYQEVVFDVEVKWPRRIQKVGMWRVDDTYTLGQFYDDRYVSRYMGRSGTSQKLGATFASARQTKFPPYNAHCHSRKSSKRIREMDLGRTIRMWQPVGLKNFRFECNWLREKQEDISAGDHLGWMRKALGANPNALWRRIKPFPMRHDTARLPVYLKPLGQFSLRHRLASRVLKPLCGILNPESPLTSNRVTRTTRFLFDLHYSYIIRSQSIRYHYTSADGISVMATAARSAAERVFSIAELLEDIVLRVIQDELDHPVLEEKVLHLTTAFKLQGINRDAYRNIAGSKKIRELALIRLGTEKLDTWDRIRWLSSTISGWDFRAYRRATRTRHGHVEHGPSIQLSSEPRRLRLDDNPDASWRALPCFPSGTQSTTLEIWQFIPSRFWYAGTNLQPQAKDLESMTGEYWRKRLAAWRLDDGYTLGQLYDDVGRVEDEQRLGIFQRLDMQQVWSQRMIALPKRCWSRVQSIQEAERALQLSGLRWSHISLSLPSSHG
ncbi:uncharacterized protein MYCFIDRAFT_176060 [Pseudocercospora fijiensis CIRAD86]|uniref:Uncharacterized protein n=1 Tax=Pseudocercospora fijiensis (strain CIRAD86) TaxID=383855 RepID=M2ZU31_PSEFD|nr:uncharacterized protein MYCFIDRAFT_176060 [Pseudocercospora fijiensis CIRAD86]EME82514.1 hypothetical protein MYCFIDRAFT_176060 [Pseudocercospora fijiensis CIRAD86]